MTTNNELLAERYGKKVGKRKPWVIAGVTILALTFFSFAIYASFIGKPIASVEVTSYETQDANHIKANFTALTGEQPAACVFKAYNDAGAVVGYAEVQIPAHNDDTKALSIVVKTVVEASVLRSDSCSVK
jgi:hypothetical protein